MKILFDDMKDNGSMSYPSKVAKNLIEVDDEGFDELIMNWLLSEVGEIGEVASGKIIVKGKRPSEYLKEQLVISPPLDNPHSNRL